MRIVINAGHTKLGVGSGAKKYLTESIETRKIAYELMKLLADTSHEVIPAVFDKNSDNLNAAVKLSNSSKADLFISIHMNKFTDSRYKGAQVIYSDNFTQSQILAESVQKALCSLKENTSKRMG